MSLDRQNGAATRASSRRSLAGLGDLPQRDRIPDEQPPEAEVDEAELLELVEDRGDRLAAQLTQPRDVLVGDPQGTQVAPGRGLDRPARERAEHPGDAVPGRPSP